MKNSIRSNSGFRAAGRRGFTLIELIAVVTLLLVVLGIAVPAFTGMINASERSLAENTLRVGMTVARDIAVLEGREAGVLFVRESNGRTRLIPVIKVGEIDDAVRSPFENSFQPGDPVVRRDVFAPVPFSSPLQLPRGWGSAGYAEPGTVDQFTDLTRTAPLTDGWYDSFAYGDQGQTAAGNPGEDPVRDGGHWLLPETAQYERFSQGHGGAPPAGFAQIVSGVDAERTPRQSYMVRFQASTGAVVKGVRPAIVLDPRPTGLGRGQFVGDLRWMRVDRADDLVAWCERVVFTEDLNNDGFVDVIDRRLRLEAIGNHSNDTVLAGAVSRIALFQDRDLIAGLGASGANRETDWLYEPIETRGRINFDMELFAGSQIMQNDPVNVRTGITRWIQGDTNFLGANSFEQSDGDGDGSVYGDIDGDLGPDAPLAQIFFVHPGTGELTEVQR